MAAKVTIEFVDVEKAPGGHWQGLLTLRTYVDGKPKVTNITAAVGEEVDLRIKI